MARTTSVSRSDFASAYPQLKSMGMSDAAVARKLGISNMTVLRWKKHMKLEDAVFEPSSNSAPAEINPLRQGPTNLTELLLGTQVKNTVTQRSVFDRVKELERENSLLKELLLDQLLRSARASRGLE